MPTTLAQWKQAVLTDRSAAARAAAVAALLPDTDWDVVNTPVGDASIASRPALSIALKLGLRDMFDVLLASGKCDMGASGEYGETTLHLAVDKMDNRPRSTDYTYYLRALLEHDDIWLQVRNTDGWTPLHNAAAGDCRLAAELMLASPGAWAFSGSDLDTAIEVAERHHLKNFELADIIRVEITRRARVERTYELLALWDLVRDRRAAPTAATAAMLGVGVFLFDARCLDVQTRILQYASAYVPESEEARQMRVAAHERRLQTERYDARRAMDRVSAQLAARTKDLATREAELAVACAQRDDALAAAGALAQAYKEANGRARPG